MSATARSSTLGLPHRGDAARDRPPRSLQGWRRAEPRADAQAGEEWLGRDLSSLRELLQRKLAWYGLRAVRIGPFRRSGDRMLLCDLLAPQGGVLCSIEVDPGSGAVRLARGAVLDGLAASAWGPGSETASIPPEPLPLDWHPTAGPHPTD